MARTAEKAPTKTIFTRVSGEVAEQVQAVADREYDGNQSMVVRVAVKRFIEEKLPELRVVQTEAEAA